MLIYVLNTAPPIKQWLVILSDEYISEVVVWFCIQFSHFWFIGFLLHYRLQRTSFPDVVFLLLLKKLPICNRELGNFYSYLSLQ